MSITTIKQDQRGLGHILLIVLVLVVLSVVGFAGYTVANSSKSGKKASTASTTTTGKSETAAASSSCVATYHDENLCKFSTNANIDNVSYKATLTSTDAEGVASTLALESDGKGNTRLTSGELNTVQLAGVTYIKTGDVWYKYPASSAGEAAATDPTAGMDLVLGAGITYKPLGKEACGSLTCFKYEVTEAAAAGAKQTVWFDTKDYLLREWKYSEKSTGTTDMTLSYAKVTISAPSPVQDFSALGQ